MTHPRLFAFSTVAEKRGERNLRERFQRHDHAGTTNWHDTFSLDNAPRHFGYAGGSWDGRWLPAALSLSPGGDYLLQWPRRQHGDSVQRGLASPPRAAPLGERHLDLPGAALIAHRCSSSAPIPSNYSQDEISLWVLGCLA